MINLLNQIKLHPHHLKIFGKLCESDYTLADLAAVLNYKTSDICNISVPHVGKEIYMLLTTGSVTLEQRLLIQAWYDEDPQYEGYQIVLKPKQRAPNGKSLWVLRPEIKAAFIELIRKKREAKPEFNFDGESDGTANVGAETSTAPVELTDVPSAQFPPSAKTAMPKGNAVPGKRTVPSVEFNRDQDVIDWALATADGICENCGSQAPFNRENGDPYLEVHHVVPLSEKGWDHNTNAVALCPNCHRGFHFSNDSANDTEKLYVKVPRLLTSCPPFLSS
jgi:hypothetical protein